MVYLDTSLINISPILSLLNLSFLCVCVHINLIDTHVCVYTYATYTHTNVPKYIDT